MRTLVTGGSGFIGSAVVDRLAGVGHRVTVVDDLSTGRRENLADALASGRVELAEADLAGVLEVLPSMKAPTVTELADSGFHAVETVVDKAGVNRLIPTLKAAGAFDILELPISKIVA